jgi:hypothetical protein
LTPWIVEDSPGCKAKIAGTPEKKSPVLSPRSCPGTRKTIRAEANTSPPLDTIRPAPNAEVSPNLLNITSSYLFVSAAASVSVKEAGLGLACPEARKKKLKLTG